MALLALATVQIGLLGWRTLSSRQERRVPTRILVDGDSIRWLAALGADSIAMLVDATQGKPTILVAFDTSCAWCDSVAPRWKKWTNDPRSHRLVGISRRSGAIATRYSVAYGLRMDTIIQLDRRDQSGVERALLSKTPWLFALSSDGHLLLADHGASFDRVDSAVRASERSP